MSQLELNNRRNWKAQTFPYDYYIPDGTKECQYCLTEKQAEILRGIIEPLGWQTRWWSDTDVTIDQDTIEAFRDDLIRRLIMGCCNDNILYRYDEDGNLESSSDGGTTYYPAPQDDIRVNPKVQFPPPVAAEGEDITCQAADSAVTLIKEQIGDQLTDDMSRYTLNQLIDDWTTNVVGASGPFQALAVIITNQIFALLISAVRAALTDDVYAILRCIFQSNMNSVAFFDGAAWEAVRSDILSQISGIAGIFLEHLVYLIGNGGLSNLARSGAGSPDAVCCPECSAEVWDIVSFSSLPIGSIISRTFNSITVQGGGHPDFGTPWNAMIQTPGNDICCTPISIEWLTGDHIDENNFGVTCGAARWPGSPNGPVDIGVGEYNTLYLRKDSDSNFTAKITFS